VWELLLSLAIVFVFAGGAVAIAVVTPNLLTITGAAVFCFVGLGVLLREIALFLGKIPDIGETVRWTDKH
jgi:hypothetical protein